MKRVRFCVAIGAGLLALGLVACEDKAGDEPLYDPENADELAHAALLEEEDLPGGGWDVVATDAFGDGEDAEDDEFDAAMESIPECKEVREIGLLKQKDDRDPAGRAQVEFEMQTSKELSLGANVEMQVEIMETVSDISEEWDRAKEMFTNGKVQDCMVKALNKGLSETTEEGVTIDIEGIKPLVAAPGDGAVVAMRMEISAGALFKLTGLMHFYAWPNSNAGTSLTVMGDEAEITEEFLRTVVKAADEKVAAAAKE